MKNKIVGEIHKITSGNFSLYITVNFELNTYEISDFNKHKADKEFINDAANYGLELLKTYKNESKNK